MFFNFSELTPNQIYHTITQTVVPRPIAWVLSRNKNQTLNLAPFSYFNAISSNPPLLMFSLGKKPDGTLKDTGVNIELRKEFVVHIAHKELAKAVTESSRTLPAGESELGLTGLETVPFEGCSLPRLRDCRVAFSCELYEIKKIGETPQTLIFGLIKSVYIADEIAELSEKNRLKVHGDRLDPIGRLGGNEYVTFGQILDIPRPK